MTPSLTLFERGVNHAFTITETSCYFVANSTTLDLFLPENLKFKVEIGIL